MAEVFVATFAAQDPHIEDKGLREELQKVRSQLRGSVVPADLKSLGMSKPMPFQAEAPTEDDAATGPKAAAFHSQALPPNADGPMVWILATGNRDDHLVFAKLGVGLRRKGYRVRVFGVGAFSGIFVPHGLEFEGHDQPVPLHRHNNRARAWLKEMAEYCSFSGPHKEEDLLLDLYMLRSEFVGRLGLRRLVEGKSAPEAVAESDSYDKRFNDFLIRTDCDLEDFTSLVEESVEQVLQWQGEDRRISAENYAPIRFQRCKAFREQMRRVAKQIGCSPIDVFLTLACEFPKYLVGELAKAPGRPPAETIARVYGDFLRWHTGEDPREFWERWTQKLPAWRENLPYGKLTPNQVPIAFHNVLLSMKGASEEERPRLCIYKLEMISPALALQETYGVDTAICWPFSAPFSRTEHLNLYTLVAKEEGRERLPLTPVKDLGPVAFGDMLRSTRQIVAQSMLRLIDESQLPVDLTVDALQLQGLRSCYTGSWSLAAEPKLLDIDDPGLFGDPGERQLARDFLAECEKPPICYGWGKHAHPSNPETLAYLVAKSAFLLNRRAIFLTGKSGATKPAIENAIAQAEARKEPLVEGLLDYTERHVLFLKVAPHAWLFPQCACTVHHGGTGTVHEALRAAVPQVVSAPTQEIKRNGTWLQTIGGGLDTVLLGELNPELLASAIESSMASPHIKVRVPQLAAVLQAENGVAGAAERVEYFLREHWRPPAVQQAFPWKDGLYGVFNPSGEKILVNVIKGGFVLRPDSGAFLDVDRRCGWLRTGVFLNEKRQEFSLQGFWPGVRVSYGHISADASTLLWDDGIQHRYEGPADDNQASALATFPPIQFLGMIFNTINTTFYVED